MNVEFDVAKLPDGEVEAFINGAWKSVEITDLVFVEEMADLDRRWPDATKYRFKHHGHVYVWDRGVVAEAKKGEQL